MSEPQFQPGVNEAITNKPRSDDNRACNHFAPPNNGGNSLH